METLGEILSSGDVDGDQPALHIPGWETTVSRSELTHLAMHVARSILASGAGVQDVVALAMPNSIDFVSSFLGVTWCRCIALPLNPVNKEDEYFLFLEDANAKYLLVDGKGNPEAEKAAARNGTTIVRVDACLGNACAVQITCRQVSVDGSTDAIIAPIPTADVRRSVAEDKVLILHTSGTTGRPKCVPHTHASLCAALRNVNWTYDMFKDVSLQVMPLFHPHGLTQGVSVTNVFNQIPQPPMVYILLQVF